MLEVKAEGVLQPWVSVAPGSIRSIALFLRDDDRMKFDLLMCLSGMDYTGGKLGAVYHLDSTTLGHKITLKVQVPAADPHIQSVESVWKTANWHEREAFDLIGLIFDDHPDLRRILLPDDWEGHPLRKDYQVPEYYNGMKVPY
ncbi:MAG TPA: NADH-quinone oxidoreductase subunit C [Chloroflexota bacterium]